ncbi:MAG: hypothetical protein QME12_08245 [Nanoarchaeota archaeon]|nr:hypothetical protein [Nanoarchaeota archaeon]
MGTIIRLNPADVIPYQTYVVLDKVAKVLPFFRESRHCNLFPCVVGQLSAGRVVIDGHHRFLLADLFGAGLNAYLAESESDLMDLRAFPQYDSDLLLKANILIAFTYKNAAECARMAGQGDYRTFSDL